MHPQTKPRPDPYVWVTWVTKLIAGECSCAWSSWHRAHHFYAKRPSDFDSASWQIDHTTLLRKTSNAYAEKGFQVATEGQNQFTIKGKVGTLAGKPDLIATNDTECWIIDTKTGQPKVSDKVQVMVYMWAIPLALTRYKGKRFDGAVIYNNQKQIISADEVDEKFVRTIRDVMLEVCGDEPAAKMPSFGECQFCPITSEDCSDRVDSQNEYEAETDEF